MLAPAARAIVRHAAHHWSDPASAATPERSGCAPVSDRPWGLVVLQFGPAVAASLQSTADGAEPGGRNAGQPDPLRHLSAETAGERPGGPRERGQLLDTNNGLSFNDQQIQGTVARLFPNYAQGTSYAAYTGATPECDANERHQRAASRRSGSVDPITRWRPLGDRQGCGRRERRRRRRASRRWPSSRAC